MRDILTMSGSAASQCITLEHYPSPPPVSDRRLLCALANPMACISRLDLHLRVVHHAISTMRFKREIL